MLNKLFGFGFMLFAFFFGAGNLIFPIKLGWESGYFFHDAMLGFLITGVGLPLIGIIASTLHEGGISKNLDEKIHPIFSLIFMIAIYLTIGPFFAIPRTASLSYEIINDIFNISSFKINNNIFLLLFSIIYFTIVFYVSIKRSKLVDIIGKILTPVLLLLIIIICILAFFKFSNNQIQINNINFNKNNSLANGMINGYQTMDALASIVFSTIIFNGIQNFLTTNKINKNNTIKYCVYSALIASLGLSLTYVGLGWIGNHFNINDKELLFIQNNQTHLGSYILISCSKLVLGYFGNIITTIIVIIACLTTAIGLVVSTSNYFFNLTVNKLNNKVKYHHYVLLFSLISLILSNQGLNKVINTSIPILLILYPITLNILSLFILNHFFKIPKSAYYFSIAINIITNIFSKYIHILIIKINFLKTYTPFLINVDFIWIIPTIIGCIIGIIYAKIK